MTPPYPNRVAWVEIPVTDMQRAKAFYEGLLEEKLTDDDDGPNPVAMLPYPAGPGAAGHLYPGQPAKNGEGLTAHVAVLSDLRDAMKRVKRGGGQVVSDIATIPAGSFFYAIDTEGNSIGVFKPKL